MPLGVLRQELSELAGQAGVAQIEFQLAHHLAAFEATYAPWLNTRQLCTTTPNVRSAMNQSVRTGLE